MNRVERQEYLQQEYNALIIERMLIEDRIDEVKAELDTLKVW